MGEYDHLSPEGRAAAEASIDRASKDLAMLDFEEAATRLGHPPQAIDPGTGCDHKHWKLGLHGRYCTCGAIMMDAGD